MNAPLYLARSGYVANGNSLYGIGASGNYLSSTSYNSEGARFIYFTSDSVYPENYYYRYRGISLRCVLQETYKHSQKATNKKATSPTPRAAFML